MIPTWEAYRCGGRRFNALRAPALNCGMNHVESARVAPLVVRHRALIFLDFDGVMHRLGAPAAEHFCKAQMLADALEDMPTVRIVVSSSWRGKCTIAELRHLLGPLGWRVIGRTARGRMTAAFEVTARETLCRYWVELHSPGATWVALDDQAHLFRFGCTELIATNGHLGLTCAEIDALVRYFGRTQSL